MVSAYSTVQRHGRASVADVCREQGLVQIRAKKALEDLVKAKKLRRLGKLYALTSLRRPHWKQDSPKMQVTAVLASIEGWLHNGKEGVSTPERVLKQITPMLADLRELHQIGMLDAWPEEP